MEVRFTFLLRLPRLPPGPDSSRRVLRILPAGPDSPGEIMKAWELSGPSGTHRELDALFRAVRWGERGKL